MLLKTSQLHLFCDSVTVCMLHTLISKLTRDKIVHLCKIIYFDHELLSFISFGIVRKLIGSNLTGKAVGCCVLSVVWRNVSNNMFHGPQILHVNDCVSQRFLLPALDQRVDSRKVTRTKHIFIIFNFACEKFTKFIIWSLLLPMGSEELRIRIYEQQSNVKLLSEKGIQKSCLQVNY